LSAVLKEPGAGLDADLLPETSRLTEAEKERIILERKAAEFGGEV
jgi:hypothetical protein